MKNNILYLLAASIYLVFTASCSENRGVSVSSPTFADTNVIGQLASVSVANQLKFKAGTFATKTITHVLGVSPASQSSGVYHVEVESDGSFTLKVKSGKPYLIVFVAQNGILTGPDMIAGILKLSANGLDTLPVGSLADVNLGTVSINGATQEASASTPNADLLAALGISYDEASYIGSADDFARRLSNPDVDGNGVLDALESDRSFFMNWQIKSTSQINGADMTMNDVENSFVDANYFSLKWTLASAYAVYNTSFDNANYISTGTLVNGASFSYAGTSLAPSSYSGGTFSIFRQWGADYDLTTQEMGASESESQFVYSLASGAKVLTFANVKTKTITELNANGFIVPFVQLVTKGTNLYSVKYEWMKLSNSAWSAATEKEVELLVQPQGATFSLYTEKTSTVEKGLFFNLPISSLSGEIKIGKVGQTSIGVLDVSNLKLNGFCSASLSYHDNLGFQVFAGAPGANSGVSSCN